MIEVILDGESIKIEAKGFKGRGCVEASNFITKLGEVENVEKKKEYHEINPDPVFVRN